MKALMFGWEFPPHILGGLGTASYGLTKGMWECGDMDITFVIPKPFGDEEKHFANIIGMSQVPIAWRDVSRDFVAERRALNSPAAIRATSWRKSTIIPSAPVS